MARYWGETTAPKWVRLQARLDAQLFPYGEALRQAVGGLREGQRIVDVGCGCGGTVIHNAGLVGPAGEVLGIDISGPMLARARERAGEAGLGQVSFERADAQVFRFTPGYDLVMSRFGIMFFDDPPAAFLNLRRALRPAGRIAFVCWQALRDNPWMALPADAARQCVEISRSDDPHAPGPFAFADAERVVAMLGMAGFTNITATAFHHDMELGNQTLEASVEHLIQLGPVGQAASEAAPELHDQIVVAVTEAVRPYFREGRLAIPSAAWILQATAP